MCYGSNPLDVAKGKNAIELASEAEVTDVLAKVLTWWVRCADREVSKVWQNSDAKE